MTWNYPNFISKGYNRWKSEYGWHVWYLQHLTLERNTDIGYGTVIFAHEGVIIEEDVQIGSYVSVYSLNTENGTKGKVILKKGCLIGSHSVILPNVVIEENEQIRAGSIVYMKNGKRKILEPKEKHEIS